MKRIGVWSGKGPSVVRLSLVLGLLGAALVAGVGAGSAAASAPPSPASPPATPLLPDPVRDGDHGDWFRHVCAVPGGPAAGCGAQVVSSAAGAPAVSSTPPASAYGPKQFHTAYSLPTTAGTPETIGIVDAYDDPTIQSDLDAYDSYYGLPACNPGNGCFEKVDQTGGTTYPAGNSWHLEIALDVETAHEICQDCKIILVEATSNAYTDLGAAVNEAVKLGANVVSNSYGGGEFSGETSYDSYYKHPGVAITASTGDSGYGVEFPAASPYVTAVGGTTLNLNPDWSYKSESVWSGTGSGCSAYEPKPAWQTDTGCPRRTVADVSADADPNTGAAVYDSVGTTGGVAWYQVGGTSLAAPLIGAVYALAGATNVTYGSTPYSHVALLHDVASGTNGRCGSGTAYLCTGVTGFDGPTGLGTPNTAAAFSAAPPTPDFSLMTSPSSLSVVQGLTTSYTVTETPTLNFAGSVSLSVSGLPAGTSGVFSPTSVSPSTTLSSTLTISTTAAASPGTYPLTINGTSGGITHTTSATLVITNKSTPTLSTKASAGVTLGGTVSDTATLSGGLSPTGTITFNLYGPNDSTCTTTPVFTSTVTAAASAGSGGFVPVSIGTYRWVASYSGDSSNNAVTAACGASNESVIVSAPKVTPTLSTTASPGITQGSGSISDTATLTGGNNPTGTITFRAYGPNNASCSGTPAFTSTVNAGASVTSRAFSPSGAGTYLWVASYSGDSANNAVTAACGATNESVSVAPKVGHHTH